MSLFKTYLDRTYIESLNNFDISSIATENLISDIFKKLHEWYVKIKNWILKMVDKLIYNLGLLKDRIMQKFIKPIGEIHKKLVHADSTRASNITDKLQKRNIVALSVNDRAIADYENFLVKAVENVDSYAGKMSTDFIMKTLYFPKKNLTEAYMEDTVKEIEHKFATFNMLGNMSVKEYTEKGHIELKEKTISAVLGDKNYDFKTYDVISHNVFLMEYKLTSFEDCLEFTSKFNRTNVFGSTPALERIRKTINNIFNSVNIKAGFDTVPEELANTKILVKYKFATSAAINLAKYIATFEFDLLHVLDEVYNQINMKSVSTVMALSYLV